MSNWAGENESLDPQDHFCEGNVGWDTGRPILGKAIIRADHNGCCRQGQGFVPFCDRVNTADLTRPPFHITDFHRAANGLLGTARGLTEARHRLDITTAQAGSGKL